MSHDSKTTPRVPTVRLYDCVQCHKRRLTKYEEYDEENRVIPWIASGETIKKELAGGDIVEHPVWSDICQPCKKKIITRYYLSSKSDVKKVLKAVADGADIGDKSLEELL